MNTPRMRTLPEAAAELKRMDNNTAITLTALRRMVKTGELPYISVASKRLINFDRLLELLENPNKVDTPCQNAPIACCVSGGAGKQQDRARRKKSGVNA